MIKLLQGLAVVVGILVGASQVMHKLHSNSPAPGGPVVVTVQVPNPIPGDSGPKSGGGQVIIP